MSGQVFTAFCDIVRQIPAGKVATYGQVARLAGMPRCARTVGYAMADCRDPSVPCHRVVAAAGLGGFSAGLEAKRTLLTLEGVQIEEKTPFSEKFFFTFP